MKKIITFEQFVKSFKINENLNNGVTININSNNTHIEPIGYISKKTRKTIEIGDTEYEIPYDIYNKILNLGDRGKYNKFINGKPIKKYKLNILELVGYSKEESIKLSSKEIDKYDLTIDDIEIESQYLRIGYNIKEVYNSYLRKLQQNDNIIEKTINSESNPEYFEELVNHKNTKSLFYDGNYLFGEGGYINGHIYYGVDEDYKGKWLFIKSKYKTYTDYSNDKIAKIAKNILEKTNKKIEILSCRLPHNKDENGNYIPCFKIEGSEQYISGPHINRTNLSTHIIVVTDKNIDTIKEINFTYDDMIDKLKDIFGRDKNKFTVDSGGYIMLDSVFIKELVHKNILKYEILNSQLIKLSLNITMNFD